MKLSLAVFLLSAGFALAAPALAFPPGPPLQEAPQGEAIHRLVGMDSRRGIKPFDLLRSSAGEYPSERLVFRDTATGSTLWKMSHNPGYNTHQYSNILAWNADGSMLLLHGTRPGAGNYWLVAADGSRWSPFPHDAGGEWAYWNEADPHRIWFDGGGGQGEEHRSRGLMIFEADISTGRTHLVWDLSAERGLLKLFRPSTDGKKFLVREMNVPVNGGHHSFALVLNSDGTGQPQRFDLGVEAGQMWFLKRSDYSFAFNGYVSEAFKTPIQREWVCEPDRGGAIRVLDPISVLGHMGVSPTGTRVAYRGKEGPGIWIRDVETGKFFEAVSYRQQVAQIGGGHLSWECDDRWIVASAGNAIYEVTVDSGRNRAICVPNTRHVWRAESEPESSPDGTKLVFNSSMLGDCDAYVAVVHLPDPPRNVHREGRVLAWDPPEHHREVAGYSLYRGSQLLDRELIHACRYELPDDGGSYTVVAVEPSGLQSPCPDHESPPAPSGLAATASSPFATELSWQPSSAIDVSYYNLYCSTRPNPAAIQENRVASPKDIHAVDWGLLVLLC